ncbi:MAG: hypothetical protein HDR06_12130 [Lachnospiraceae bacterium]|nr:hypothetical protein [Lachnospiraceae bacterium]
MEDYISKKEHEELCRRTESGNKKILTAIYIIFMASVAAIAVATMFPANGPPTDQISQVRQQIKSEQMIQ